MLKKILFFSILLCQLTACSVAIDEDPELSKHVRVELIDWHVAGLWVVNSPVAWIRVTNYNYVPIENILISYETFDEDGNRLNKADYLIEEEVKPNQAKNFIEQYLGLVDLYSQKLKISLVSVSGLKKKKNH